MPNIVNVGYASANYYVIASATTKLLIDVGWPGTVPKLQAALKRTGVPLAGIAYLLVTHYHPDHAGAAQELKQQGVKLIVLENQVAGIAALRQWMKPQYHYVDITPEDNVNVRSAESRAFLYGLGLEGEILITPGHSDDSVTLILDSGMAFTGDLPPPGMFGDPQHPAERSWALIRAHHVHTVYPGHGPVGPLRSGQE
jgi:glyoxylase-like metal-dependent hydrolase (beta-lactamase superfamily II)